MFLVLKILNDKNFCFVLFRIAQRIRTLQTFYHTLPKNENKIIANFQAKETLMIIQIIYQLQIKKLKTIDMK